MGGGLSVPLPSPQESGRLIRRLQGPWCSSWGGRVCPLKPEVRKFTKVFQGPGNFLLMMDGDFLKACGKAFRSWE